MKHIVFKHITTAKLRKMLHSKGWKLKEFRKLVYGELVARRKR